MLRIDLLELDRAGRVELEAEVPADSALWSGTEIEFRGPLTVRLVAQEAGRDVVVRGRLDGAVVRECRRCLAEVVVSVSDAVAFHYQAELADEEEGDAYVLPARGNELDLSDAVREHTLLAVPRYVECGPECRGLCPQCGKDLNEGPCDCETDEVDERWAPLRRLKEEA